MDKQIVAIGASEAIAAHFAGKDLVLLQEQATSVQSLSREDDVVGCYLLHWEAVGSEPERFVSKLLNASSGPHTAPLLIVHNGMIDGRLQALSKDPKVAGVFKIPSEFFKLDMAIHEAIFGPDIEQNDQNEAATANPFLPQKKHSISEVLSRCASASPESSASSAKERKVHFFCESPELLKQAMDAFTRIDLSGMTYFSSPIELLESIQAEAPQQLMMFVDTPSKSMLSALEKICLNRKTAAFKINLIFPGDQSRAQFSRVGNKTLFDQATTAALTPKELKGAVDQFEKSKETQTIRTLLTSIRTLISKADVQSNKHMIADQIAVLAKIPGKERWAARENFFAHLASGDMEAGITAFKNYQKEHPCDLEMWLELIDAAQKKKLNTDQCLDGAIRTIATMDFATEMEHRQLIKALEDHGNPSLIKKYIDARIGDQPHDRAIKLAFATYAAAINDPASELQWVLDLLMQSPTDPGLIIRCGRALSKLGDYDSAARTFSIGAKAAPGKRLIFELKHVESLIDGNRMIKAAERIQLLKKDFPSDSRITRLEQRVGKHFATAGSSSKLMAASSQ